MTHTNLIVHSDLFFLLLLSSYAIGGGVTPSGPRDLIAQTLGSASACIGHALPMALSAASKLAVVTALVLLFVPNLFFLLTLVTLVLAMLAFGACTSALASCGLPIFTVLLYVNNGRVFEVFSKLQLSVRQSPLISYPLLVALILIVQCYGVAGGIVQLAALVALLLHALAAHPWRRALCVWAALLMLTSAVSHVTEASLQNYSSLAELTATGGRPITTTDDARLFLNNTAAFALSQLRLSVLTVCCLAAQWLALDFLYLHPRPVFGHCGACACGRLLPLNAELIVESTCGLCVSRCYCSDRCAEASHTALCAVVAALARACDMLMAPLQCIAAAASAAAKSLRQ